MKMKKGEIYQGIVIRMDFPNKGIVTVDGVNVTVKNALPGQTVSFRITKKRNGQAEGKLLEVVEKASCEKEYLRRLEDGKGEYTAGCMMEDSREEHAAAGYSEQGGVCRYAGICGGCLYQGFPYEEQLKIKEAQVLKLLGAYLGRLKLSDREDAFKGTGCKANDAYVKIDADKMQDVNGKHDADGKYDANGKYDADGKHDADGKYDADGKHDADGKQGSTDVAEVLYDGILPSPKQYGYRNKMEFTFGDETKDGQLSLGLHKRGSFYDILTVSDCLIMDEDYRKILMFTRDYFAERNIPYFHRMNHTGYLRHLLVRKAARTGDILVALVTSTQIKVDLALWADGILEMFGQGRGDRRDVKDADMQNADMQNADIRNEDIQNVDMQNANIQRGNIRRTDIKGEEDCLRGRLRGILHIENDSLADAVKCDRQNILYGTDAILEELLGLRFSISAFSFFQTNSLGAEVLYELVREYVQGKEAGSVVYDLYSGTGTIAQMLAPAAKKVIGVEIVEDAVEAAKKNAAGNGLSNCEFLAGDVLKVLDQITEKPDYIILDPPRDGIHPKALQKIIGYGVENMVYISCKPTSLARDLEMLTAAGYEVKRLGMVDMFPGTGNIETVCLLSKLNVEHHIEVEINLDEMDLTAAESKATYEEIKAYVKEKAGLQVSNLYIAQVKRKCGIIERVNYNLPKSEDSKQPKCPPEKEEAIRAALEYFGMI